jgi:hypothetical protein
MKWNWELYWTDLGYDRGKGRDVLNTLMYFVIKCGKFFKQRYGTSTVSKMTLISGVS